MCRGTWPSVTAASPPAPPPQPGEEVIDAGGLYALPGLLDLHFHGAVGHDFCDGTEEAIQALADFEASKGILAICPATMTYSEEILNGVMDAAAAHKNGRGADLVGINMEGPFISPHKLGAQNPAYLHLPDVAMFRRLQKRVGRADQAGGHRTRGGRRVRLHLPVQG